MNFINETPKNIAELRKKANNKSDGRERLEAVNELKNMIVNNRKI